MVNKTEIEMGEIMDAVLALLAERGMTADRDRIVFKFIAGRERRTGKWAYLGTGTYLTAECETRPRSSPAPTATDATAPPLTEAEEWMLT